MPPLLRCPHFGRVLQLQEEHLANVRKTALTSSLGGTNSLTFKLPYFFFLRRSIVKGRNNLFITLEGLLIGRMCSSNIEVTHGVDPSPVDMRLEFSDEDISA